MFVFDKSIPSFCLSPHGCSDHTNNPLGFLLSAQAGRTPGHALVCLCAPATDSTGFWILYRAGFVCLGGKLNCLGTYGTSQCTDSQ